MQAWGEGLCDSPEKDESRAWRAALDAFGVDKSRCLWIRLMFDFFEGATK